MVAVEGEACGVDIRPNVVNDQRVQSNRPLPRAVLPWRLLLKAAIPLIQVIASLAVFDLTTQSVQNLYP